MDTPIASYLRKQNLTATAFGDLIGVTRQQASRLANGKRQPSGPLAIRIESITGGAIRRHDLRPDLYPCEAA